MTAVSRPSRVLAAVAAAAVLLGAAACSGSSAKVAKSSAPAPSHTSGTSSSATAKPVTSVNPLTGGKPSSNGVVAVKIDDTGNGRPQRNIDQADIVYIEEVEGGLTRLAAVFNSSLPVVEAVRSTRPADPELLSQYGKIAFTASGGARVSLRILDRSYLKSTINDRNGPGFQRDSNRPAPYNLTANLATIAKVLKSPRARNVGFTWSYSQAQLAGAKPGTRIRTVVGGTPIEFRYDAKTHRYTRYIDGTAQRTAAGKLITTPNVLVQFCKVEVYSQDRDVNGNPNQFTYTIGAGKIVLFRDGMQVPGTWKRAGLSSPTTLVNAKGQKMLFRPGGTWVVLTRNGAPLSS
ncbi:MAG: DUF3048 domain-containing protein [Jatrophihabitans sp.]